MESWRQELYHYGIKGQHWGIKRGPPYPIGEAGKSNRKVAGKIDNPVKLTANSKPREIYKSFYEEKEVRHAGARERTLSTGGS